MIETVKANLINNIKQLKSKFMKKKIFGAAIVVVIAVSAMINVNLNKVSNKGDLALANVEALATDEWGNCPNGCLDNGKGCYCIQYYPYYREA